MKLFGSKKDASHAKKGGSLQKKILLGVGIAAVIAIGAFAAAKLYVRPVEVKPAAAAAASAPVVRKKQTVIKKQEETGEEVEVEVEVEVPASHLEGVYNVLVCGTDDDGTRTDTIMIAHLDTRTGSAALMSIPRDTVVDRGGYISKINSVYGGGREAGMERLKAELEKMLGIPIDGYVLVDLDAFKKAVDLLGGVWYDVPQDMYYDDPSQNLHIDLKQGYQLLDGEHAMELVRFRKGYASQDIQRTQVQQGFLLELAKQCMQISSLSEIKKMSDIFYEDVITDMDAGNLLYFIRQLGNVDLEQVKTYTVQGAGQTIDGISYYPLFDWSVWEIVNEAFNPYDAPIPAESIQVITPEQAKTYAENPEPEEQQPAEAEQTGLPQEQPEPYWDGTQWVYPTEPTQSDTVWQEPANG